MILTQTHSTLQTVKNIQRRQSWQHQTEKLSANPLPVNQAPTAVAASMSEPERGGKKTITLPITRCVASNSATTSEPVPPQCYPGTAVYQWEGSRRLVAGNMHAREVRSTPEHFGREQKITGTGLLFCGECLRAASTSGLCFSNISRRWLWDSLWRRDMEG